MIVRHQVSYRTASTVSIPEMVRLIVIADISCHFAMLRFNSRDGSIDSLTIIINEDIVKYVSIPEMVRLIDVEVGSDRFKQLSFNSRDGSIDRPKGSTTALAETSFQFQRWFD